MVFAYPSPLPAAPAPRRRLARRLGLSLLLALVLGASLSTAIARADTAPQQWLPTSPDLVRTLRPCSIAVGAPTPPVCWSMTEDTSAWMAQPAGSPYPWGQCTYYVGVMRPDIWNDRAPASADPLSNDWDAWTWVEHAQVEGLSVNGTPHAGDVMVYSRAAVGNDTGHVAVVDSVGGTDASTGDLKVTVSEMNVDGLDDASLGQGDTTTLLLPPSQLVPGMIQFIHEPGAGYAAPVWPSGSDSGYAATTASAPPATPDPSLSVGVSANHVETVSESTSPLQVTVTALPGGAVVKRMTAPANQSVSLGLPGGSYKVCVDQAPDGRWPAVSACAQGAWQGPPTVITAHLGRARSSGHQLTIPVSLSPQVDVTVAAPTATFSARLRISVRRTVRAARGRRVRHPLAIAATATVYQTTLQLHNGRAVLRLPVSARTLKLGHAVLQVTIPSQTSSGLRIASAQLSEHIA